MGLKKYKILVRVILVVMLLGVTKILNLLDEKVENYAFLSAKTFLFDLTRLNWNYGFFTSSSDKYQYIKYDIFMGENELPITKEGQIGNIGHPVNAIRLNTAVQHLVRDSIYLEAGSRAIALYLFNRHPEYPNVDFSIQFHHCDLQQKGQYYHVNTKIDTFFNQRLSY